MARPAHRLTLPPAAAGSVGRRRLAWPGLAGPAMPKRSCPFGEAAPLQLKTRVGLRELSRGVRGEEYHREIFGEAGRRGRSGEGSAGAATPPGPGLFPRLPLPPGGRSGPGGGDRGGKTAPNSTLLSRRQRGPGGCSSGGRRRTWRAAGPPAPPPPPAPSAVRRSPAGRPRTAAPGAAGAGSCASATTGSC